MIKILIKKKENQVKFLEVKGHANSAPHGQDLICAAVSAVVTGGFNALQDLTKNHLTLREGYASLEATEPLSHHDEIVVETIIVSLETIADHHQEFIEIKNL